MKSFIISDTHFSHKNILLYENRPFRSIEDMDKQLINNWNSVVSKEDKIFHLGDVSFTNKENTHKIISQLNGHKTLIMGNHDRKKPIKWWQDIGFDVVSKYPIIYLQWYILSHEPVYLNENMPYKNIHGHLHSISRLNEHPEAIGKQYINVCVEKINYTPIDLKGII